MLKEPSQRQLKVGETIKRELSEILSKELADPEFDDLFITVSEVRMSPDLKYADAFVVPMLGRDINIERFVSSLNAISYKIRAMVNKKVKLRFSPEINFIYDHTFDNAQKLNKLLNE